MSGASGTRRLSAWRRTVSGICSVRNCELKLPFVMRVLHPDSLDLKSKLARESLDIGIVIVCHEEVSGAF